jgi:hypothetical protein
VKFYNVAEAHTFCWPNLPKGSAKANKNTSATLQKFSWKDGFVFQDLSNILEINQADYA